MPQPEDHFEVEEQIVISRKLLAKKNWLQVLKSCPVSMDNLPVRSRALPKQVQL